MNNNQGIIIDPTKSNKMIQSPQVSAPSTNDSSMSLGITKAVSNGIMDLGMAYQKLKDFQSKSYGLTAEASIDDDISNFMLEMQTNKDIYKTDEGINALKAKIEDRIATYRKTSLEQGYDMEYANAFEARFRQKLQMAENNFLAKNYEYQEKVTLDNYIHSQEMAQQNNERYMALGDYSSALAGTRQIIDNMISAGNAGIIDMAKVATGIKGVWKGNFNAFGLSLINKPNAQAELERYSKMTAGEFFEHFKGFNTKINGEDFMIGADEYEEFKSGINQAQAELNRRNKGIEEMTLVEKLKKERDWDEKPIETYLKSKGYSANHVITDEDRLNWNNGHYRSNFKSLDEMEKKGVPIIWEEKGLLENKDIFNSEAPAEQLIKSKLILKNEVAGTSNERVQANYLDSTNRDSVVPTGSAMIDLYLTDTEFAKSYDTLFSPQNRAILEATKNLIIPEHALQPNKQELSILKENALNGDFKSQRLVEDITKFEKAAVLIPVLNEKGGVVDEKWAKKAEIEKSWIEGKPFIEYSSDQQQALINVISDQLGDKKYWIGDYKISSTPEIEKDLVTTNNAVFKNKVNVDFGNNGAVILPNNVNGQATVEATKKFFENAVKNKELIDPVTNKPIGSVSSLKVVVPLEETTLGVTYKGNKVLYQGKLLKIPVIFDGEEAK